MSNTADATTAITAATTKATAFRRGPNARLPPPNIPLTRLYPLPSPIRSPLLRRPETVPGNCDARDRRGRGAHAPAHPDEVPGIETPNPAHPRSEETGRAVGGERVCQAG